MLSENVANEVSYQKTVKVRISIFFQLIFFLPQTPIHTPSTVLSRLGSNYTRLEKLQAIGCRK